MPYYQDIDTLFIHIPKTGGTSLENYLKKKSKQTLYSGWGNNILPDEKLKKYSLQHQSLNILYKYKNILKIKFNKKIKIITIVRNPYNRIISDLFWYKLINKNTTKEKIYNIIKKYVLPENNYDNHNIPQFLFLVDQNKKLYENIKVFKTETLTNDLHNFGYKDYIGLDKANTYFNYLNVDSINLINKVYKKDFETFDYEMITEVSI